MMATPSFIQIRPAILEFNTRTDGWTDTASLIRTHIVQRINKNPETFLCCCLCVNLQSLDTHAHFTECPKHTQAQKVVVELESVNVFCQLQLTRDRTRVNRFLQDLSTVSGIKRSPTQLLVISPALQRPYNLTWRSAELN
jgi:hypothetical protein